MKRALFLALSLVALGCNDPLPPSSNASCSALDGRLLTATARDRMLVLGSNFTTGMALRIDPATMVSEELALGITGDTIGRMAGDALVLLHRSQTTGDNLTLFDTRTDTPRLVCQLGLTMESERVRGLRPWANAHDAIALDDHTLLVARYNLASLAVIDLQRSEIVRTLDLAPYRGSAELPYPDALMRVGDEVWVTLQRLDDVLHPRQRGLMLRLDATASMVRSTIELPFANPVGPMRRGADGRVVVATLGDYSVIGDGGLVAIEPVTGVVETVQSEAALSANIDGFALIPGYGRALKLAGRQAGSGEVGVRFELETGPDRRATLFARSLWGPASPEVLGTTLWVGDPGEGAGATGSGVRRFDAAGTELGSVIALPTGMRPYDFVAVP